jgi:hypothetical protein
MRKFLKITHFLVTFNVEKFFGYIFLANTVLKGKIEMMLLEVCMHTLVCLTPASVASSKQLDSTWPQTKFLTS